MTLRISRIAAESGRNLPTIRCYESIGLLAPAGWTNKGRSLYTRPDVARLKFIRRARGFGLSIQQVRELLAASDAGGAACGPAAAVIEAHLLALGKRRAELRFLEDNLKSILASCRGTCSVDSNSDCTIFSDVASAPDASQS